MGWIFALFLLLGALLSWLAGQARLVLSLAVGLAVFLGAVFLASLIAAALAKLLSWNIYDHACLYIGLNLLASCSLTVAWVAHATKLVDVATLHASWWQGGLLFFVGLLATVGAVQMIQEFFEALGLLGYAVWGLGWRFSDRNRRSCSHGRTNDGYCWLPLGNSNRSGIVRVETLIIPLSQ